MPYAAPMSLSTSQLLAESAWAEVQEPLDRQLSPLGLRALAALGPRTGERILDVGCGSGQTVVQLAEAVGASGAVVGIDIAPGLLAIARKRTSNLANVCFIQGDAQSSSLQTGIFDAVFSRFGVMAFANPVEAFGNFH